MRIAVLRHCAVVGAVAAGLLAAVPPAGAVTAGDAAAYGAQAHVTLLGGVLGQSGLDVDSDVDTGRLAQSAATGPTSASEVDTGLRGLVSAQAITSESAHDPTSGEVMAAAKLTHVALPVLAAPAGAAPTASVLSSECHATAAGVTGGSDLGDLDLGRIGHLTAATPNLTVGVPGVLRVTADEQIRHADGSLTVNALHIELLGGGVTGALGSGDIVLASSTCGPATPVDVTDPPTPATPQVSVVPAGAPQTGDGTLATVIVR